MALDLSQPTTLEITGIQARQTGQLQQLFASIEQVKKNRNDRKILNEFSTLRAANPNAAPEDILNALTAQFGGQASNVLPAAQTQVLGQSLQPQTTLTPEEQRQKELIGAGIQPRATVTSATKPFKKTPEQSQRDSDIKFLDEKSDDALPFQVDEARDRLKALPPGTLNEIEIGSKDKTFAKLTNVFLGKIKPTATRTTAKGREDRVFGEKDFERLLEASVNEGLKDGVDPASMKEALIEWWNRQFEKEKDQDFQKFLKIETGAAGQPEIGSILEKGGKKWEVVGLDAEGEILVEEVR